MVPAGGGASLANAEDALVQLQGMETEERVAKAEFKQKYWGMQLKEIMESSRRDYTRDSLPAWRMAHTFDIRCSPRSPTNLGGPTSSTGGQSVKAPSYVGVGSSVFAKAMSVDRVQRWREESSISRPSARRVLSVDDSMGIEMACRTQPSRSVRLKIDLHKALTVCTPAAASGIVEKHLGPELSKQVGKCRAYDGGRILEVIVQDDAAAPAVAEALARLGLVTRQANVNNRELLAAVRFGELGMMGSGPLGKYGATSRSEVDGGADSEGFVVRPRLKVGAGAGGGAPFASTPGAGVGEWSEGDMDSLGDAMAKWDARLQRSSHFREAVRRTQAPPTP